MARIRTEQARLLTAVAAILVLSLPIRGWTADGGEGPAKKQMGGSIQGNSLSLSGATATFAGGSPIGSRGGAGDAVKFEVPRAIAMDAANVYVVDDRVIRRIVIATGEVKTLAGAAKFNSLRGIATDGTNLYVMDDKAIRTVAISTGQVTTLAGKAESAGSTDGTGSAARFNSLRGIATDGTNLYAMDDKAIRKVVIATAEVTTAVVIAGWAGETDSERSYARWSYSTGIATDGTCLYVVGQGDSTIRKIVIATGEVTVLAGRERLRGHADGVGGAARFSDPWSIATDGTNLYVTDRHAIRKVVIATGKVTTLAGAVAVRGSVDGTGAAARFDSPAGIATDGTRLYVADPGNQAIRAVSIATGEVTTMAGRSAGTVAPRDGAGTAARFNFPRGVTTDGTNLYVTDSNNHTIRTVSIATGEVTTLAGTAEAWGAADGRGAAASFALPRGITTNGTSLYVADTGNRLIRKVTIATGEVATSADAREWLPVRNGTEPVGLGSPEAVATDGESFFVADSGTHTIRRIVIATGEATILAGKAGLHGFADGTGAAARFFTPSDIATDGRNIYVADSSNYAIRKVVIATGEVTTLAGKARSSGSADGKGAAARFRYPEGITTDGTNLYVGDTYNHTIRRIVIATGEATTLAGKAGSHGSTDGTGAAARFGHPQGITTDGTSLFVADTCNHTVRKVSIATGAVTTMAGKAGSTVRADRGASARFGFPLGVATDGANLYVTDARDPVIRKVSIATGEVTVLAGTECRGYPDGTGWVMRTIRGPSGITTDGANLYLADGMYGIRRFVIATGELTTLPGAPISNETPDDKGARSLVASFESGFTTDGTHLYVAEAREHVILKVTIATGEVTTLAGSAERDGLGFVDGTGTLARFCRPEGITTDGANLYVVDRCNLAIRKIVIATGEVTTLAGTAKDKGFGAELVGVSSRHRPLGITTDGTSLYVADSYNHTIRKIVIATGEVTTLAGAEGSGGFKDGTGAAARFDSPAGITTDGRRIFVTDRDNYVIRVIE